MTLIKQKFCVACNKTTTHEQVRDLNTSYWRCIDCVIEILKNPLGIFVPPHSTYQRQERGNCF